VAGKSSVTKSGLEFTVDRELTPGKYSLRIAVCDKAENKAESEYPFLVPEEEIVRVSVWYEDYSESKADHKRLFRSFLDEHKEMIAPWRLHVYHYALDNEANKTYCRNLHLRIDNQFTIFCWQETGSMNCSGIGALNVTGAVQKHLVNDVFTSDRTLSIQELAPGGFAYFSALVGFHADFDKNPPTTPTGVFISGTYVSEGYARTTIVPVKCWIPLKRINSNN
jgi:hypothetical protein